ncbi:hypothetical protein F5879DRAFT_1066169 [Lentinula edodes]|uniref:F-box domain-containing protein n=1 Tax=Lentinula edodes TaxID=5353 RepID=A0A1Q3E2G8_LENED|nr:hypothetical protein F5879DRAFT_1066169 [Lentinula edodes]KAJ3918076.1 hypothetical protein F5877DRAFT_79314 [Lentinula edodes]GAW01361.1 hypothetical protein LENED_002951 [Lentinula edodes]
MARRSLRIRQRADALGDLSLQGAKISAHVGFNDTRNSDERTEEEKERPLKRTKKNFQHSVESSAKAKGVPKQFRRIRGKFGLLERLTKDVPLEIVLEIFCYLNPHELLRLAQTVKFIRSILMCKSSASIWRIARGNVGDLPPLPEDLSEPQYAHLLYEPFCQICNRECDNVLWMFRMRCCESCAESTFPLYDKKFLARQPPEFRKHRILPRQSVRLNGWPISIGNDEIAARFKAEFQHLQTPEEQNTWIASKKHELQVKEEHAHLCTLWQTARLDKREKEQENLLERRKDAILIRLAEIGWREEAEISSYVFSDYGLVRQPQELTDSGWNRIKDKLVKRLSDHKARRLVEEQRQAINLRRSLLEKEYNEIYSASDHREPFPSLGDILSDEPFETLISDSPLDENMNGQFFREKLLEYLPSFIEKWKPVKMQELVEIMRKSIPEVTLSDLPLATSIFRCAECPSNIKMHYPQMFYHRCCFRDRSRPWSSHPIVFDESGSQAVRTILQACALNPSTTTIQKLHSVDPLIECTTCHLSSASHYGGRLFMRWPHALVHSSDHNFSVNSFGELTEKIFACEPPIGYGNRICCVHCHEELPHRAPDLRAHLLEHSEIDVKKIKGTKLEEIQEHWYWDPRCALRFLRQSFRCREALI